MNNPDDIVVLAHGGGGLKTRNMISNIMLRHLGNPALDVLDDSACVTIPETEIVFTTDSYVVDPIFFPGGDIGRMAVCGTVNDLVMQGGEPRYLSLGLILEEGLAMADLDSVVKSIGDTSREVGVPVVTGDTKVVERRGNMNSLPGLFINTSGIGARKPGIDVGVSNARPGDAVIVSGTLGDHGVAVLSRREGLAFESEIVSDVAPLSGLVAVLLEQVPAIRCLRDPTRGGLAAAACDIAEASGVSIRIDESAVPVHESVRGACGLLGLDPLTVANEGKAVIVCDAVDADRVLALLHSHPLGANACIIGNVNTSPPGLVLLRTAIGGERIVEIPTGEDLPRIC